MPLSFRLRDFHMHYIHFRHYYAAITISYWYFRYLLRNIIYWDYYHYSFAISWLRLRWLLYFLAARIFRYCCRFYDIFAFAFWLFSAFFLSFHYFHFLHDWLSLLYFMRLSSFSIYIIIISLLTFCHWYFISLFYFFDIYFISHYIIILHCFQPYWYYFHCFLRWFFLSFISLISTLSILMALFLALDMLSFAYFLHDITGYFILPMLSTPSWCRYFRLLAIDYYIYALFRRLRHWDVLRLSFILLISSLMMLLISFTLTRHFLLIILHFLISMPLSISLSFTCTHYYIDDRCHWWLIFLIDYAIFTLLRHYCHYISYFLYLLIIFDYAIIFFSPFLIALASAYYAMIFLIIYFHLSDWCFRFDWFRRHYFISLSLVFFADIFTLSFIFLMPLDYYIDYADIFFCQADFRFLSLLPFMLRPFSLPCWYLDYIFYYIVLLQSLYFHYWYFIYIALLWHYWHYTCHYIIRHTATLFIIIYFYLYFHYAFIYFRLLLLLIIAILHILLSLPAYYYVIFNIRAAVATDYLAYDYCLFTSLSLVLRVLRLFIISLAVYCWHYWY